MLLISDDERPTSLKRESKPGIQDRSRRKTLMKTIAYTYYRSPEVLQFKEVAIPVPIDAEILIRIHAVSLN
jgi:hypothetical protein